MVDITQVVNIIVNVLRGKTEDAEKGIKKLDKTTKKALTGGKEGVGALKDQLGKYKTNLNKAIFASKKFPFALLGILFLAMQLQRIFGGLLKPALQAAGVFEIWAAILQLLFLPVALLLLPFLLQMLGIVSSMPKPLKLLIGGFVLFGFALSALVFLAIQFVIFFSGIGSILISIGVPVAAVTAGMAALGSAATFALGAFVGIPLALFGIVMLMKSLSSETVNLTNALLSLLPLLLGIAAIGIAFGSTAALVAGGVAAVLAGGAFIAGRFQFGGGSSKVGSVLTRRRRDSLTKGH